MTAMGTTTTREINLFCIVTSFRSERQYFESPKA